MIATDHPDLTEAKRALLQQRMRGLATATQPAIPHVKRRPGDGPAPLSLAQEQLWYFSRLAPDNPVYNETASIRKDGPLDLTALRRAFNEIVHRHEIWRTTFRVEAGLPRQVAGPAPAHDLPLTDLSALRADEREQAAARLVAELARRPYRLDAGPPIRPLLVRFSKEHHRLYLAMHHLVFDGVSLYRIVLPELVALYEAMRAGLPSPLTEPALQYADYALWEADWAVSGEVHRRLAHWRRHLEGAPTLELPLDRPRPPSQRFRGGMEPLHLSAELVGRLRQLARAAGCTLFQVAGAAFSVLLQRYSGQDEVVFGTMADLRQRPELESMVGYCLTPLPLRVDVSGDPTFLELLARASDEVLSGLANLVPFERLVREVQPQRDPSLNPIYQAMFVMEPPVVGSDPSWSMHQMDVAIGNAVGHAKLDLHIELDERPEGHVSGRLIYNGDIFDRETARRIGGHLQRLLEAIADDPRRRISELPLMTDEELRVQTVDWNATEADYPDRATLQQMIQAQAERAPSAVALGCAGVRLTYAELERRANRLAHSLAAAGVSPGDLVAICVPRSLEMVVGMLGILKAGAAYVPLDPLYPAERLAFMVEDSGATVVVTQAGIPAGLAGLPISAVAISSAGEVEGLPDTPPEIEIGPEDLAYVIYTSGSTGKPKGVRVPHRAVVNLICSMAASPGIGAADTVLAVTTYSFDIAVVELWLPLVSGARVELAPAAVAADGRRLAKLFEQCRPTFMQATPATWRMLLESGWKGDTGLVALVGGESVDRRLADRLLDRCGRLWNVYGPTETTVWSTLAPIERGARISIGRPLANTSVYVLDRHRRPLPVGAPGEIFIGGHGVSHGYLNRPELTAERFVADPFRPGARMYATGDLGRFRSDGCIEHLGRLDHQVKVRGYRIELGEIEAALLRDPDVASAVVVAGNDRSGERSLVAYVVPARERTLEVAALRALLRRTLPEYMVPSLFVPLVALPLTPNGKVDRHALPAPESGAQAAAGGYVAPRTALEAQLAAVWTEVLGVERVGVQDDFFDLGGHSLLAVRLLAEVHRACGVEVPVAAIFQGASTIAGMATAIEIQGASSQSGLIIKVQETGSRPPLFFVHAHETSLLTLRHFTRPLGPDQPVYALVPPRHDQRIDQSSSVVEMAASMVAGIREAQPVGPYYIAGHSFGGILAYEIASQLRLAGQPVDWLGVLDTTTPAEVGRWLQAQLGRRARLRRLRQLGLRRAPAKVLEVVRRESNRALAALGKKLDPFGESRFDWEGVTALALRYEPAGTDAPLELFTPIGRLIYGGSRYLGWEHVHRGAIELFEVPGDHLSMLTEPQVAVLAGLMAERIRAAQARRQVAAV
ncbi:MAG: amino acid adenylation domain-containing protein [Candidatus Dormibacteraeota bacterium]|nr:amino acid adenylation domain-containing protein [Candidatus Dormibacteraeota bacterium]